MVDVADRVRRLRERSGLTQAQVAERAGLERVEVNQIERGKNSCGSWRVRAGLATAFSVRVSTMAEYLDGTIDLAEVASRIAAKETSGELRAVRLLRDRPEWPAALAAAQAAAAVMGQSVATLRRPIRANPAYAASFAATRACAKKRVTGAQNLPTFVHRSFRERRATVGSTAEDLSAEHLCAAGYRVVFAPLEDASYVAGDGVVVVSTVRPGSLASAAEGLLRPRPKPRA